MATSSYVKSLIGSLQSDAKAALGRAFDYVLEGNLRYGPVEHQKRAENFAGVYLNATTASVADTEFTVAHGLAAKPRVVQQVLDPQSLGSKLVRLEVSRVADEVRLYFKSPETSAPITLYVEA